MRTDGRAPGQLRPIRIQPAFLRNAFASALVEFGNTRVVCAATPLEEVPPWMRAQGVPGGWITAEYEMLPASTPDRVQRERKGPGGRTMEIQRLVGRSLRAACDIKKLGARTLHLDCDVLDADGGTRCAAITGAMVALRLAVGRLLKEGRLAADPIVSSVAAVSAGVLDGVPVLDLCYAEDSRAEVDMNVVMTADGRLVEVQGTAEHQPFPRAALDAMLDLASSGIREILACQRNALAACRL